MSDGIIAQLKVLLGADISDYEAKMGKTWTAAEKSLDKLKDFGEGMSLYVTAPIIAAATAITVWAAEEETADARTAASLRNVGISYDKVTGQVHSYISGLEALTGFEDTSIQDAFTNLVNITGSAKTSMEALGVVTDVAAGTGKDLESVATAVGRALNGQDTALKRMGISLQANMSPTQILTALLNKFGGDAAQVAQTVQGKWNQIKNSFQNVAEAIGHSLEPITKEIENFVLKLLSYGQSLADWFAQQPINVKKWIVGLIGLVAAIGPVLVAIATLGGAIIAVGSAVAAGGGWAIVSATLGAVATAAWAAVAPFIAWIAAIAAVVAAGVILYSNWDKISAGLAGIFGTLATAFTSWLGGFLSDLASLTSIIPGFGAKLSTTLQGAADSVLKFSTDSASATQDLANQYEEDGGYMDNTTNFIKGSISSMAEAIGFNMDAVKGSLASTKPNFQSMGADLDQNTKKWKDWAAGLKVTVQDLATGIYNAMSDAVKGTLNILVTGTGDWKQVLMQFLLASLEAVTMWAIAKMTIFQYMAEALAAAISSVYGWVIIAGLIAATIAVGHSSIPAMATGGMSTGETLALIGDNPSGKEVVMPLDSPQTTKALSEAMPDGTGGGVYEQTIIMQLGDEQVAQSAVRGMPSILRVSGVTHGS